MCSPRPEPLTLGRDSRCIPDCSGTCYVFQVGIELTEIHMSLPLPAQCWDQRCYHHPWFFFFLNFKAQSIQNLTPCLPKAVPPPSVSSSAWELQDCIFLFARAENLGIIVDSYLLPTFNLSWNLIGSILERQQNCFFSTSTATNWPKSSLQ